jgi:seryl-tRNA synthetase
MLDIRFVRENTDKVIDALKKRGQKNEILNKFLEIELERRDLLRIVEEQRQLRNKLSQEIGRLKKEGGEAAGVLSEAKSVSDNITAKEET